MARLNGAFPFAAAAAAFALAACQANETADNDAAEMNETTVFGEDDGGTVDPATTDLNLDSGAGEVDQAVNQTDAESDLGDALDATANQD